MSVDELAVVTWKWAGPVPAKGRPGDRLGSRYTAEHVNCLRAMVARNLTIPHRFVCVTDDPAGLHPRVDVVAMPAVSGAHWRCCRRLQMFSPAWRAQLGDRVLHLDLDTVIVGDITPLVTLTDAVTCWWAPQYATRRPSIEDRYMAFNPSVLLFDPAGALRDCWDWYASDPAGRLDLAEGHGWNKWNSDMAILNDYIATRSLGVYPIAETHGIYGLRDDLIPRGSRDLPENARIVSFCDPLYDPAMPELQERYGWIKEHWRA